MFLVVTATFSVFMTVWAMLMLAYLPLVSEPEDHYNDASGLDSDLEKVSDISSDCSSDSSFD
jgi:hypothetical protein